MLTHTGRCRGKVIVNTLVDAQAVVVAEALEVTLDDVEGKALIDMLASGIRDSDTWRHIGQCGGQKNWSTFLLII